VGCFDDSYREQVTLADGARVVLRALRPRDGQLLSGHFAALSPESRRRRFLGAKSELSAADLRQFTHVDGERHFALVAVCEDSVGVAAGVARFITLEGHPPTAEPAISVIDCFQRRGLGGVLIERLITAALERGIARFHWEMASGNEPVRRLAMRFDGKHRTTSHGATTEMIAEATSASDGGRRPTLLSPARYDRREGSAGAPAAPEHHGQAVHLRAEEI
jgi:GNAT superfamily N-acetyltransferase